MDYTIVIPTYNRVDGLIKKTLQTLKRHRVPPEKIVLFVADTEEAERYADIQRLGLVSEIRKGVKGLGPQRNVIMSHFPEGTPLVCLDDDVEGFYRLESDHLVQLEPDGFEAMVQQGFAECVASGASFWGIYPCKNAFFMKKAAEVSYDLKFVIGSFWGCFSSTEIVISGNGEKEDYQRCIQYWERDKRIVRLNHFCHKTATYKNSGGMQSEGQAARVAREREAAQKLLDRYPEYVLLNTRRKSIFPELLLRSQRKKLKLE
jgi:glycosyltransferase involved in cell wall biosynthesis